MDSVLFWIWLNRACTPGSGTFDLLLRAFNSPYEIYDADEERLRSVLAKYNRDLARLLNKDLEAATRILTFCNTEGITLIPYDDPRYPTALRTIPSPPTLLYCRGILPQMNGRLSVAVVGTRKMSEYGKRMTFEIARDLARAGAVVVSGLALGIDGVANAAAINGGGETVAVLGSGIDVIYPAVHAKLAETVAGHGAVITEFPPGTRPEGRNFPTRNRIISGLAQATAVMEGDLRSGALITARRARQQERKLYALPGRVDEPGSEGPSMLIRDGARILTSADDILTDFEKVYSDKINIFRLLERSPYILDKVLRSMHVYAKGDKKPRASEKEPTASVKERPATPARVPTEEERERVRKLLDEIGGCAEKIYDKLRDGADLTADDLVDDEISVADVMMMTAQLEMFELIEVLPGGILKRKNPY